MAEHGTGDDTEAHGVAQQQVRASAQSPAAGTVAGPDAASPAEGDGAPARDASAGPDEGAAAEDSEGAKGDGTRLGQGPGRLLLSLYGVFTVAALSRSIVQISTKYHDAPLAYLLSAAAGVVYAVITVALWRGGDSARKVALVSCSAELVGVLAVGTLTLVDSSAFPDATVWSDFGIGYVFLPIALPVAGLLWLRKATREAREAALPRDAAAGA